MATTKFKGTVEATQGFRANSQVTVTTSTLTINPIDHQGKIMNLARAAGITVTLPAATGTGNVYRFWTTVSVTSNNNIIKVANASDTMQGTLLNALATGATPWIETAGGTDDTITMNGTTTGGLIGSYVELVDQATNVWALFATLAGSGTLATPLSATV
jgi:hypothetical protein